MLDQQCLRKLAWAPSIAAHKQGHMTQRGKKDHLSTWGSAQPCPGVQGSSPLVLAVGGTTAGLNKYAYDCRADSRVSKLFIILRSGQASGVRHDGGYLPRADLEFKIYTERHWQEKGGTESDLQCFSVLSLLFCVSVCCHCGVILTVFPSPHPLRAPDCRPLRVSSFMLGLQQARPLLTC